MFVDQVLEQFRVWNSFRKAGTESSMKRFMPHHMHGVKS